MKNEKNQSAKNETVSVEPAVKEVKEGKFNYATKQKAVELAIEGVHLKEIQRRLGPNPKATERYIIKANAGKIPNFSCKFANYKEVLADLESRGIKPMTVTQIARDKVTNGGAVKAKENKSQ